MHMSVSAYKRQGLPLWAGFLCWLLVSGAGASVFSPATLPESGSWYNPEAADRTGFNMEIQNGVLSGAYYGFDGDGNQAWLLFSGPLFFDADTDVFSFTGELTRSSGGGCIVDCADADGAGQHSVERIATIRIEFFGRSQARFRIGTGEYQPLVPLTYGTSARSVFSEFPEQQVANFEGTWVLEFSIFNSCGFLDSASVVRIENQRIMQNAERITFDVDESVALPSLFGIPELGALSNLGPAQSKAPIEAGAQAGGLPGDDGAQLQCSPPPPAFLSTGELVCEVIDGQPGCVIRANESLPMDATEFELRFPVLSSSDSRFEGVIMRRFPGQEMLSERGSFRAIRLNYD